MVYDQCPPISWLKRKPVTEQTSLSTAHTYPPMSSDLHHIMCTYIFILFLYGSNSIHKTETHEYPPMSSDMHHITHIYFFIFFCKVIIQMDKTETQRVERLAFSSHAIRYRYIMRMMHINAYYVKILKKKKMNLRIYI